MISPCSGSPASAFWPWSRESDDVELLLAGETNLLGRPNPRGAFEAVQATFDRADAVLLHAEGLFAMSGTQAGLPDIPHKPAWQHSEPRMLDGFRAAGVSALSLASNVAFGRSAITATLDLVRAEEMPVCGIGRDRAEAHAPAVVTRRGVRIGMLSYTSVFWPYGHAAEDTEPGVAVVRARTALVPHRRTHEMPGTPPLVCTYADEEDLERMRADVTNARARCDVLVVSCHWGVSGREEICDYQKIIGRTAIDAGASIVIGHHPHVLQGMELWQGRPIFYSLGNFAFDWPQMNDRHRDGLLVRIGLDSGGLVRRIAAVPVQRDRNNLVRCVHPLSPEGAAIAAHWRELSCALSQHANDDAAPLRDPRALAVGGATALAVAAHEILVSERPTFSNGRAPASTVDPPRLSISQATSLGRVTSI